MKDVVLSIGLAMVMGLAPARAHAYIDATRFEAPAVEGGAGGRFFTGAPGDGYGCSVCHRGAAPPSLTIAGIPGEGWDPGAIYELTIALPEGVRSSAAAIEIADELGNGVGALAVIPEAELTDADRCRDGTTATAPVSIPGRLVARAQVCGAEQVRVRWTAPPSARTGLRVHAAMVAGNDSGDPSGDGASVVAMALQARGAPEVEGARLSARCSIGRARDRSLPAALVLALLVITARRRRTSRS